MCGRFTLTVDPADLRDAFPEFAFPTQAAARFNIAPTQPILVLPNDGTNKADFFVWGLIPSWAKDPSIGSRLINARAETLAEKPSFRSAYKYHRCLIFADGFFEWQSVGGRKYPYYIRLKNKEAFAFAGIWAEWKSSQSARTTFSIITTEANPMLEKIHNTKKRMPVILRPEDEKRWLEKGLKPEEISSMLRPYDENEMEAYTISRLITSKEEKNVAGVIAPFEYKELIEAQKTLY